MNANEMLKSSTHKVYELESLVSAKSGNKNPDYYKTLKEYKLWYIIDQLILDIGEGEIHLDEAATQYFKECSEGIKRGVQIEVHEGDNALELLNKYEGVKDLWNKIKKACDSAGLKIVGSSIVKA